MDHAQPRQQHEQGPHRADARNHIHDHGLLQDDEVAHQHLEQKGADKGHQGVGHYFQDVAHASFSVQQGGHGPVADDEQQQAQDPGQEDGDTVHGLHFVLIDDKPCILVADAL